MSKQQEITAYIIDNNGERPVKLAGRFGWALEKLAGAGVKGLTTAELPAGIRWSHYVFILRRDGFVIDMRREQHAEPFVGNHGRYTLRSRVRIERPQVAEAA